ncbi:kinase-like domain-containing protein [Ilyonectria sp. MPI-CAGE-AT-0026]|nr:kinase-like domain-containing protein [Ilyonectria sp. MPI-CAGE-AT-0026]
MSPSDLTDPTDRKAPIITSYQDLTIIESWDSKTNTPKSVAFYHVTSDEVVYFGQSFKNKRELTFAEFTAALEPVNDDEIYPEVPKDVELTIAPDHSDDVSAYIKRPGLVSYEEMKGTEFIPKEVLNETLTMEQISKAHHPNIVGYYGCHVRRGRITAIVLERLDQTLTEFESTPGFQHLDKTKFIAALESAVDHLHSLGLAHNDINPSNIMVKDGVPILIDFGSCQPFGTRLQSLGTSGWYEELFFTSEKKHDTYALGKLREWFQEKELKAEKTEK